MISYCILSIIIIITYVWSVIQASSLPSWKSSPGNTDGETHGITIVNNSLKSKIEVTDTV